MIAISQTTLSIGFFVNENVRISIKFSLKFVPKGPISNIPALVQIMDWRLSATSNYLNQWWLVYWRIYASLGLNELRRLKSRASRLLTQHLLQADNKESTKAPHYWPFVISVDSPHNWPAKWKVFLCHDVVMTLGWNSVTECTIQRICRRKVIFDQHDIKQEINYTRTSVT